MTPDSLILTPFAAAYAPDESALAQKILKAVRLSAEQERRIEIGRAHV